MDDIHLCADCGEIIEDENHICELLNENTENWESTKTVLLYSEVQNIEELINEVFKRPPLWNSSLPYEKRGPSTIKSLWSEIDKRLNLRPGIASIKWRNLRDTYVRKLSEQNKYIPSGSAAAAKAKPSWPYLELMGFLRSTITRRKTFSNIKPPESFINEDKHYVKEPSEKINFSCPTTSRNNIYKKDTFLEERYLTSSSATISDAENLENSLQENFDPQNRYNFKSMIPDYSLKRKNFINLEETKISKQPLSDNTNTKNVIAPGKKRRSNKKDDELLLLQQSLISEIKKTDESILNNTSDPVVAFCNYLATQFRTFSQDDFTKCQRKILSLLFELQDTYNQ